MPGSGRHAGLIVFLMAMAILSGGTMIGGGDQMENIQETISAASTAEAEEVLKAGGGQDLIFAVFAEDAEQFNHAILMAESIRAFAGRYRDNPVWIFVPHGGIEISPDLDARLRELRVELVESTAPEEVLWFYYAAKVFAAAQAEEQAEERGGILAWLDEDTIVLQEPEAFALQPGRALAYRPVMHKNIGTLYAQPVDDFWARIYQKLSVPDSALFPMITPADGDTIRPYFNAGLLVVRPERGILRRWAEDFTVLAGDTVLASMSREDRFKRIFLHQTALVGAILNRAVREEMLELPAQYNYPLFFKEMYGASHAFDDIADVVTLRYDVYFRNPAPDWKQRLKGPPDKISWLIERLGR